MIHPNPSTALARVLVDELATGGVGLIVISPGSRSGALAIAAAEHDEVEVTVAVDERSAAFNALGASKAGRLSAVVCTSGSAAANFLPAVVEADLACVPLILVTADRPKELHGVGANQTIDQHNLYGDKVRSAVHLEAPDAESDLNVKWRRAVAEAVDLAVGVRPGPVHINVAFREPTVPVSDDGRTASRTYDFPTPRLERPSPTTRKTSHDYPSLGGPRGLVLAGEGAYDRPGLMERADVLGWPVLATALSGLRGSGSLANYHHVLSEGVPSELEPDVVVAVGSIGPDPRLEDLVASATTRARIDAWGRVFDERRNATQVLEGDVVALVAECEGAGPQWRESWQRADAAARSRVESVLSRSPISGGSVVRALNAVRMGALAAASSLPIREVDAHFESSASVFANRGASGIDGFVSTALGVSGTIPGTVALVGDLSLLHDSNGFLVDRAYDACFVVLDNNGGGLFDALPQARHAPEYERLFVTPHGRDLRDLAVFHKLRYAESETPDSLVAEVEASLAEGGLHLIRVPIDRAEDLAVRQALDS